MTDLSSFAPPRGGVIVTTPTSGATSRRAFLRAAPAASFAFALPAAAITMETAPLDDAGTRQRDGIRARPAALGGAERAQVIRDFADPLLELTRLLREASEIEHALLLQYLYGAFSLKPAY